MMGRRAAGSGGTQAATSTKSQIRQLWAAHGSMAWRAPDRGQCFSVRGTLTVAVTKAAFAVAVDTKD